MQVLVKRGRPLGYKLSESTKIAISHSKTGQKHSQDTKDKISKSLISYFRTKNPLSVEMKGSYVNYDIDGDLIYWIDSMREFIDSSDDILTYRSIYNIRRQEQSLLISVEELSHNVTPELLVMFKQHCEQTGSNMDVIFDEL